MTSLGHGCGFGRRRRNFRKTSFSDAFLICTDTRQNGRKNLLAKAANLSPPPLPRRLIGYAHASTDDQLNETQVDELRAAGCHRIHQEHGSGASRARPVLAKLLKEFTAGDVLVVVRLDRLARSVSYLLDAIEDLEKRGLPARCAIRSIPRLRKGCFPYRCPALSPSSSGRGLRSGPSPA